ncbi:MAG: DUF4215 domain-containing protein [Planctomycetes bacterium]|nr:DUF4215 domain-containing protein [Planctomycetota bacterium]
MNHRSKTRLCYCTGGGLLIAAAAGAVGLSTTALMAPRAHVGQGAEVAIAQSAIATAQERRAPVAAAQQRRVPLAQAPAELGFRLADGTNDPSDGGVAGGGDSCFVGTCPLSSFDGLGNACLNQNCNKDSNTVACAGGAGTTPNIFARCFDLAVELPNLVGPIEINEVKWEVSQYTDLVNSIPITINVYSVTGCPPTVAGSIFLGSVVETVGPGSAGTVFFSKPLTGFNQPIVVSAGDVIVVEIQATQDGTVAPLHFFRPQSTANSCTDGFLLAAACGITDYLPVSAIGFANSQIEIVVSLNPVAGAKPVCGNGTLEACEECDDGNTVPLDGCDQNCEIELVCGDGICDEGEIPCNCPADCGAPPAAETGLCSNNFDDDCDGLIDCADPDCALDPLCIFGSCCLQDGTCVDIGGPADCDLLDGHFTLFGDCSDPLFCSTGCFYANGNRAVAINGNQCAPDAFAAAVADDFILADIDLGNPCLITNITFGSSFFNQPAGVIPDPNVDWQGVMVTVYADGGTDGMTKGPGGQPVDPPPSANCDHEAYFPGGIIYSQPSSDFIGVETAPGSGDWTIDVAVNMTLKKKVKYWLSVQPIMNFGGLGQIALASSDTQHGHPAQRGFPAAGIDFWQETGDYWFVLTGEKSLAPPNDACASRLAVGDGWVHFDTTGATTDGPDHPIGTCGPFGDGNVHNDIWYNYTAKCDGEATFSLCKEENFDTRIAIYDGCVCPPTALLGCDDDGCTGGAPFTSTITVPVIAGNCYKVRIGGFGAADVGNGTLSVECNLSGPCPKDFEIIAPGSFPGDTCGAGNNIGLRPSEDQSFTITIPNDGEWEFSMCNSPVVWDGYMYLGTACGLDDIAENDDGCGVGGGPSIITATLVAGDYWVTIEGFAAADCGAYILDISKLALFGACCLKDGTCVDVLNAAACTDPPPLGLGGTFQGGGTDCLTTICPPANDNCDNRVEIFNGKTLFDNTNASTDGPQCDPDMEADLWFNYNATFKGLLTVDTCQDGPPATLTDTVLTVYDGCDCTTIHCGADGLPGQELASDDDSCGVDGFSSTVTVPVVAGNCYKIQVGGWQGLTGSGTITITGVANADISGPGGAGFPDGCVDAFDLGVVLGAWCSTPASGNPPPDPPCVGAGCLSPDFLLADLSGPVGAPDGCVDAFDLAKILANWCSVAGGNPCGTCF